MLLLNFMDKPIRIIGHGLSGCVLGLTALRHGIPFRMEGLSIPGEASLASSGIIAPVTGRRYVKAWDIDIYLPVASDFYRWTESLLGSAYFFPIDIVRFLNHPEAQAAWEKRAVDPAYTDFISLKRHPDADRLGKPYGILTGGYRLDTQRWLQDVRSFLMEKQHLEEVRFDLSNHQNDEPLVLATGALTPSCGPGIIPNKGEALIIHSKEWNTDLAFKDDVFILPLGDHRYWAGSYYAAGDGDPHPTLDGKTKILEALHRTGLRDVEIVEHWAGIRPTVRDRRPLVGEYPLKPNVFLFNGMGTKATSLAPYWAKQLLDHLISGDVLPDNVSPSRLPEYNLLTNQ